MNSNNDFLEVKKAELERAIELTNRAASDVCWNKEVFQHIPYDYLSPDEDISEEYEMILDSFQSAYTSLDVLRSLLTRYRRHFVNTEEK